MKSKTHLSLKPLFLVLIILSVSCGKIGKNDPCDDTIQNEIAVSIKATVHVLDKDKQPIPNQEVSLYIYKEPCGAQVKGTMHFSGDTNEGGWIESTVVGYNLRNSEDKVWVDAHAVNLGNGSADEDSELVSYKYGQFIVGTVKEVHVYIYRNF